MPPLGPIKRHELIRYLRQLGFDGPYPGAKHEFMKRGSIALRLPNPHRGDIGVALVSRLLREAEIEREEWERL
jgi:hypothetical protein